MKFKVGSFLARGLSSLIAVGALGLAGCGASEGFGGAGPDGEFEDVGEIREAIDGGWTNLSLLNGWKAAANSNTPAVGIANGVVTFRGALNGTSATSATAFCLSPAAFANFRPTDVGYLATRTALANGNAKGTLVMTFANPQPGGLGYCVSVNEEGVTSQPGPNAKAFTSLEGVSYERSFADSKYLAREPAWSFFSPYPMRGTDGTIHPQGTGVFAKVVDGFVRFQGNLTAAEDSPPTLLTLPSGQGMRPGNTVYVPVTLCPLATAPVQGRIVIRSNGKVDYEGNNSMAWCGVSLDGASFSMASSAGSQPIALSNNWVTYSPRAVRVRNVRGVIRLEGAVKDGTSTTIGTLPTGMRPAKTIYVIANGILYAQSATLSINTSGVIKVITPVLVAAQPGISLDGVSFGI